MTVIAEKFSTLRRKARRALIPYVTAGDPGLAHSREILAALIRAGADAIEVGVPFSDPLADGPVIQRASQRALGAGTTLTGILDGLADFQKERISYSDKPGEGPISSKGESSPTPLVLFSYLNPIWQMGLERFARRAKEAGVDGVLLTDLIPEEASEIKAVFDVHDLDLIFLVAPTSTDERIQKICQMARGFIYAVSRTGTTGTRTALAAGIQPLVERIRRFSPLPVVVGFGISSREQVEAVWQVADGAVVGSAIVADIEAACVSAGNGGLSPIELGRRVEGFVRGLLPPDRQG